MQNSIKAIQGCAKVVGTTSYYLKKANQEDRKARGIEYKKLCLLKQSWAKDILSHLNVSLTVVGEIPAREKTLFVGNHLSYIDIPLVLSLVPASFVAKKEIQKWPVFGNAASRIDTVFVDRNRSGKRMHVAKEILNYLKDPRKNIIIFPSGTTCIGESKPWKTGALRIAKELGIKVQPFRINYLPLRKSAYIDKDIFLLHLWRLIKQGEVKARIEFSNPMTVDDIKQDTKKLQAWCAEEF